MRFPLWQHSLSVGDRKTAGVQGEEVFGEAGSIVWYGLDRGKRMRFFLPPFLRKSALWR